MTDEPEYFAWSLPIEPSCEAAPWHAHAAWVWHHVAELCGLSHDALERRELYPDECL